MFRVVSQSTCVRWGSPRVAPLHLFRFAKPPITVKGCDWQRLRDRPRLRANEQLMVTDVHTGKCNLPIATPKCLAIGYCSSLLALPLSFKISISVDRHPAAAPLFDSASLRLHSRNLEIEKRVTDPKQLLFDSSDRLRIALQPTWSHNLCESPMWMNSMSACFAIAEV